MSTMSCPKHGISEAIQVREVQVCEVCAKAEGVKRFPVLIGNDADQLRVVRSLYLPPLPDPLSER